MPFTVNTVFTGAGTGTWTYVDDVSVQIALLTGAVEAQTILLEEQFLALNLQLEQLNFSPAAGAIPGTPAASLQVIASSLNDVATVLASTMDNGAESNGGLRVIATALSGINAQIASGVSTMQLSYADQVHNNEFQQQTTNAALERSGLPPTVVPDEDLQAKITKSITDAGSVKAQTAAIGFIETQLNNALTWTSTTLSVWVGESFVGASAAIAYSTVKGWLGLTKPQELTKKAVAEAKSITRSAKVLGS